MRYNGGKAQLSRQLAPIILTAAGGRPILEPFAGGLSMTEVLQPRLASDASLPMVTLLLAVRGGWRPPVHVTEPEYQRVAAGPRDQRDPYTCFVGQCCSYGGKWFAGYGGRPNPKWRDPIRATQKGLLRKVAATRCVEIIHQDYRQLYVRPGDVIYCDPPYAGTTHSWPTPPFDTPAFWDTCRRWAGHGATVLVSEFHGPPDAELVWGLERARGTRHATQKTCVERLYRLG